MPDNTFLETAPIQRDERIRLAFANEPSTNYHKHNFLELAYVVNGSALHEMNGNKSMIREGDYFIIDYGIAHKYESIGDKPLTVLNCLFIPSFIDRSLLKTRSFNEVINNYLIRFNCKTLKDHSPLFLFTDNECRVKNILLAMVEEYNAKPAGYLELLRCYLLEIIITSMRLLSDADKDVVYGNYSNYIMKYVNENYMNHITLSEIANTLGYSLPYLSQKFKNDTGISFNNYLQKVRIEQSCRLLANTDKKIIEVAQLSGYDDIKFFNKVFRKILNVTPSEFKRMIKNS